MKSMKTTGTNPLEAGAGNVQGKAEWDSCDSSALKRPRGEGDLLLSKNTL